MQPVQDFVSFLLQLAPLWGTAMVVLFIWRIVKAGARPLDAVWIAVAIPLGAMLTVWITFMVAGKLFFPDLERNYDDVASRSTVMNSLIGVVVRPRETVPLLGQIAGESRFQPSGRPITEELGYGTSATTQQAVVASVPEGQIPTGPLLNYQLKDEAERVAAWSTWATASGFPGTLPPGSVKHTDWIPEGIQCVKRGDGWNWLPVDQDNFDFSCPQLGISVQGGGDVYGGFPDGTFTGTGGWPETAYNPVVVGPTQARLIADAEIRNAPNGTVLGVVTTGTSIAVWQGENGWCRNSAPGEPAQWFDCATARVVN